MVSFGVVKKEEKKQLYKLSVTEQAEGKSYQKRKRGRSRTD
jgi:hypothetical protein